MVSWKKHKRILKVRNLRKDTASLPGGYKSPQELPEAQNKNGSHNYIT